MKQISFEEIVSRLKQMDLPSVDLVVGIGTGGVIPASLVAYKIGCAFKEIRFSFRDSENNPQYEEPQLIGRCDMPQDVKSVILVDDVSVSGKTLKAAKSHMENCEVKTLVLAGSADYVVFPEIKSCVHWPWKEIQKI